MKVNIEVFTSPTCPYCPSALAAVEKVAHDRGDVNVIEHSMSNRESVLRAQEYGIMTVPTVLVFGNEIIGFRGRPAESDLNNAIDMAKGIKHG